MLKKWFLSQNAALGIITTKSTFPKFNNSLLHQYFSFPISLTRFCTTTSESVTHPFSVSYLISNFGFSPQSALNAFNNNQVPFKSAENPNSIINFFKNRDFSHSDIQIIIRKAPWLLSLQPHNIILPKFEFFLSKGATSSDIVSFITENPRILRSGLEKRIIPLFELLSRFLKTNKDIILCLLRHSTYVTFNPYHLIAANINLMTDFGVSDSNIARLLQKRPSIFGATDLINSLEEVHGLGFDPSMATFGDALFAKKCMSKTRWDEKVDVFKKWGWSDEAFFQAFRLHPSLMLTSIEKINFVMHFWVNQLGWDSLELSKCPHMFGYSLHQRIIPRASVLQFLLMKGLRDKNESLATPFTHSEKFFLSKFIFKEECDYLLKLYVEKMKPAYAKENNGMPFTN